MNKYRFVGTLLALVAGITWPLACGNKGPNEPIPGGGGGSAGIGPVPGQGGNVDGSTFSKVGLINTVADCITDRYTVFDVAATTLRDRIATYAASLDPAALASAQQAWRDAMAVWQEAEMMQVGPAASSSSPGGRSLRSQIYSYPQLARCGVDLQIVNRAYQLPTFSETFVNSRGLDALEYLLFHVGPNNACAPTSAINTSGEWATLVPSELTRRRADYALAAANDVVSRAQTLLGEWQPGVANFRQQFVSAGAGSKVFASDHAALNAVSDALFYLDKELKDGKIDSPSSFSEDCTGPCPERAESIYARASTSHVVQNLIGFRRIFSGCGPGGTGIGFDDWLSAVGSADLANQMQAALAIALDAAQTLQPPLEDAFTSAPEKVVALHAAIKALNTPLKTTFVTRLNLDLSMMVEGDND